METINQLRESIAGPRPVTSASDNFLRRRLHPDDPRIPRGGSGISNGWEGAVPLPNSGIGDRYDRLRNAVIGNREEQNQMTIMNALDQTVNNSVPLPPQRIPPYGIAYILEPSPEEIRREREEREESLKRNNGLLTSFLGVDQKIAEDLERMFKPGLIGGTPASWAPPTIPRDEVVGKDGRYRPGTYIAVYDPRPGGANERKAKQEAERLRAYQYYRWMDKGKEPDYTNRNTFLRANP